MLRDKPSHVILFLATVFICCSCDQRDQSTVSGESKKTQSTTTFQSPTRVEYKYEGTLGIIGVPSGATAYSRDKVAAKAVVKYEGEFKPGSLSTLEIEESHFDTMGKVVYRGIVLFQIRPGGYVVATETPLQGTRPFRAFGDWPSGN